MNKPFCLLIIIVLFAAKLTAQGFHNETEFRKAIRAKGNKLDTVEGIWRVTKLLVCDKIPLLDTVFDVAIYKEYDYYRQYSFEKGVTVNHPGIKKFERDTSNLYRCFDFDLDYKSASGAKFHIIKNKFSYNFDATAYVKKELNADMCKKAILRYDYRKIYPLKSDTISHKLKFPQKGNGFLFAANGFVVTNYDLVDGAYGINVKGIGGNFLKSYKAELVVADKDNDIAILRIKDKKFVNAGEIPYTIDMTGKLKDTSIYIYLYPQNPNNNFRTSFVDASVNFNYENKNDTTSFKINADIEQVYSISPIFDRWGSLVSVLTAKHRGEENISFVTKFNYVVKLTENIADKPKIIVNKINPLKNKTSIEKARDLKKCILLIEAY